jgi:hypothetical protein
VHEKVGADLRTFIPPFLGLLNPDQIGRLDITVYLYDAHTGELIWFTNEMVSKTESFPIFTDEYDTMTKAEWAAARRVVSHLMPPPAEEAGTCGSCTGACQEEEEDDDAIPFGS